MALQISMLPCLALKQSDPEWFEVIHCVGGSPSLAELHQQWVRISTGFLISVNTNEQKVVFNTGIKSIVKELDNL